MPLIKWGNEKGKREQNKTNGVFNDVFSFSNFGPGSLNMGWYLNYNLQIIFKNCYMCVKV